MSSDKEDIALGLIIARKKRIPIKELDKFADEIIYNHLKHWREVTVDVFMHYLDNKDYENGSVYYKWRKHMNDNIKDLLISTSLEDITLGLEICRRLEVPIVEIEAVYHEYVNPDTHNQSPNTWHDAINMYHSYLKGYNAKKQEKFTRQDIDHKYFKSWKH